MTLKETLVQNLGDVLEETSNLMTDRMVLESLAKNGSVSLEEAEFFDSLVRRVITEAAEEFVPDELIQEDTEPMILTGEDGTVYNFNPATCELIPIEGTGPADDDAAALENPGEGAQIQEDPTDAEIFKESTEAPEGEVVEEFTTSEDEVVEEATSTEVEGDVELTESQQIVSNLIKSLGA